MDAFALVFSNWVNENMDEEPNAEAKKFFDLLEVEKKKPLYEGCELSLLSVVSWLINIECECNLPYRAVDIMLALMKEICPPDNEMTNAYYLAKKFLAAL